MKFTAILLPTTRLGRFSGESANGSSGTARRIGKFAPPFDLDHSPRKSESQLWDRDGPLMPRGDAMEERSIMLGIIVIILATVRNPGCVLFLLRSLARQTRASGSKAQAG